MRTDVMSADPLVVARPKNAQERNWSTYRAFEVAAMAIILVVVAFGVVMLAAAIIGIARPAVVVPFALLASIALVRLWQPLLSRHPPRAISAWVVIVGLLVIVGSSVVNLHYRGEHVLVDRDPGGYVNGGRWLARHGNIVEQGGGGGLNRADGVTFSDGARTPLNTSQTRLEIQSLHLLPAYLALGHWLGGDAGLFATPVVLGGVALLALFLLALLLLPDWIALAVLIAFTINFAWIYTVRDAFSEPLMLLCVMGGLFMLLVAAEDDSIPRLAVASFVFFTVLTVRIDALAAVILVVPLVVFLGLRNWDRGRRGIVAVAGRRVLTAVAAGAVIPVAVAVADIRLRSWKYVTALHSQVRALTGALGVAIVGSLVASLAWSNWRKGDRDWSARTVAWARREQAMLAAIGALLTAGLFLFAWLIRPHLGEVHMHGTSSFSFLRNIQISEGDKIAPSRHYDEVSISRLMWYMGTGTVLLAIAGIVLVVYRAIRGRANIGELGLASVVAPSTLIYLWQPAISPDQPWMIRRYIPIVMPGLLLFAGLAVAWLARRAGSSRATRSRRDGPLFAVASAAAAVVMVASPLAVTWPVRTASTMRGSESGVHMLCNALGPKATAVVVNGGAAIGIQLPTAIRSFCGLPAGWVSPSSATRSGIQAADLATRASRRGRSLRVVGPDMATIRWFAPTAQNGRIVQLFHSRGLVLSLEEPPSKFSVQSVTVWVADVPVPGATT